ncbi:MAG: caspase family protein [Elusimicrobia bacterium]|nr:caspase family protein [Elusimicrobiota bacterium]
MARRFGWPVAALLLCSCSAKLIRPKSIALCRDSACETVADAASRERLLSGIYELFRSSKGRDFTVHAADPRTRAVKKDGISFFIQGGPIPGRSTISSVRTADVRFIDREKSEVKLALKTRATYVGIPTFCSESDAVVAVSPEEAKLTYTTFCSWLAIGNGRYRLEWSLDMVDLDKGIAGGYWSMHGAGVPLVGWGSGYMIARFRETPASVASAPPKPDVKPTPKPLPVSRPAAPVAESVEVMSEAVSLKLTAKLSETGGDLVLDGGEEVVLRVAAENSGRAIATEVEAALSGEPALVGCLGERRALGAIAPGGTAEAAFKCRLPEQVPSDTADLRVELFAGAKRAKAAAKLIRVGMKPAAAEAAVEVVSEIGVDDIPPRSRAAGKANAALVIGLGRYREKAIPGVKYAARDAEVVARYLENVAGVAPENMKVLVDETATKSDLEAYLEDWLPRHATADSTVFFYYAGHGAPEPGGRESFLVPYEGHPDFPSKLYALSRVYAALARLPAKAVVVMLDSCFSGAKGRSVTREGARPLVSTMESSALDPKLSVLAGASGSQMTSDLDATEHGLFTYFLLKGMRGDADGDRDGTVTLGELFPFVREKVAQRASRELNRDQTPVLLGGARSSLPISRR